MGRSQQAFSSWVSAAGIADLSQSAVLKGLPTDWGERRLDEVCEGVYDCPHSTPALAEDGPLVVRTQDMRSGVLSADGVARVSEETYRERIRRAEPRYGDLLYSREGTYFGIAAEVPAGVRLCLGQRMVLIRPNPAIVGFRFLRYWLNSPVMARHTEGSRDGSVAERLNLPTIRTLPVALPPIRTQRAISHILGSLDDKIELNRRISRTLKAMPRLLFKSWFVDFDPVRAKAEGRDPGLPKHISCLFPGTFDGSELGEIPRAWTVGPIRTQAALLSGGTPKTGRDDYWNGDVPWASAKDVSQGGETFLLTTERSITEKGLAESATQLIPAFATVVVARGATTGRMVMLGREMAMNQTCYALASTSGKPFALYCQVQHGMNALVRAGHGSIFNTITMSTFDASRFVLAPEPALACFEGVVSPLFDRIRVNSLESRTLAALRDTLLPKLISGELRIPDAERIVGKAV